ncbi:MAG: transcription termination/antitermination protein NusA, partial [Endomicrobia bacterium]|nr:transcription termination/antitermination protein NusA [Endomicrobiia bacterium]
GVRIKPIITEIQGERIDLIPYTEDIAKFIAYSLSPWEPQKVEIVDEQKRIAKVYLPQNVYETTSGKNNINLNLAKELTGWDIKLEVSTNSGNNIEEKK